MAAWVAHAGAALLVPSGPYGDHLFVILNQPAAFEGYGLRAVVLVNFSTIRTGLAFDNACIVEPAEHPFVRVRSHVYYRGARIEQARHVEECVASGVYRLHQPVSKNLLARIKAGVQVSRMVAREIRGLQF